MICWFASSLFVGLIAKEIYGRGTIIVAALLFYTSPLVSFYSLFATTDSVLLLFWTASIWLFIKIHASADDKESGFLWILAGITTGLAILSKYTALALPLGYLVFLLADERGRQQLRTAKPYIAGLIALGIFATNLWWNITNDFVAIKHTTEIAKIHGLAANPSALLQFWLEQLALFSIVGSAALLWNWREAWNQLRRHRKLLASITGAIILLLVISGQALMARAFANWAAPTIFALALLALPVLTKRPVLLKLTLAFNILMSSVFYFWPILLNSMEIEHTKTNNPWIRSENWADPVIERLENQNINTSLPLLSDHRSILGPAQFAISPKRFPAGFWQPNQTIITDYYDQSINLAKLKNPPDVALFISERANLTAESLGFSQVKIVTSLTNYYRWRPGKSLHVYKVGSFEGYPADPKVENP